MNHVVVTGRLDDMRFQRSQIAAEYLKASVVVENEGFTFEIISMLPAEWDTFRENKTRELGGVLLTKMHKDPSLTFRVRTDGTGEYIGGCDEFLDWANNHFGYVDPTTDLIYKMKAKAEYRKYRQMTGRPYVFLDFQDGSGLKFDRVVVELFNDLAPLTAENFRCLCTGERGEKLHYKGKPLHRVVKGGWIQGGDIEPPYSGAGGFSIYGGTFADESFSYPHDQPGVVGMCNKGPHTNNSQFYITAKAMPTWDHKYVSFGRVVEGLRTLKLIDKVATNNDRPTVEILVADCGQLE